MGKAGAGWSSSSRQKEGGISEDPMESSIPGMGTETEPWLGALQGAPPSCGVESWDLEQQTLGSFWRRSLKGELQALEF